MCPAAIATYLNAMMLVTLFLTLLFWLISVVLQLYICVASVRRH